uniref:ISXO2-like transposase domain-containing protein n=1 Tax=Chromera velia CCMP2878 TaxID=1169474 RepID=A0A0G4G141_9ALVE|eukprot:Cvel_19746.t1-p1 / transcript=Cvel_19746.t1 / gene=Cvel_19746 / organism=Chromera_velia_CCMP2878 / gene_product=hypothetical protein / transcript_product=hypothetical protein / location=Cvel_scaffold1728:22915-30309(+) / protein_length=960 / sequence_SO=supercontig / SO=protein_coding / is_pseudo=false
MEFSHADLILQARWWAGGKNSSITKIDLHNSSDTTASKLTSLCVLPDDGSVGGLPEGPDPYTISPECMCKLVQNSFTTFFADWKKNFREAVAQITVEKGWMRPGLRIGGLNPDGSRTKVFIDESLAGHVKFHRGKPTDGVWIVGAVEETEERRFFFIAVEDRSAETLEAIIAAHIDKESHLISDCWTGYSRVKEKGLVVDHDKVNHSEEFKNEETGACTNHIEASSIPAVMESSRGGIFDTRDGGDGEQYTVNASSEIISAEVSRDPGQKRQQTTETAADSSPDADTSGKVGQTLIGESALGEEGREDLVEETETGEEGEAVQLRAVFLHAGPSAQEVSALVSCRDSFGLAFFIVLFIKKQTLQLHLDSLDLSGVSQIPPRKVFLLLRSLPSPTHDLTIGPSCVRGAALSFFCRFLEIVRESGGRREGGGLSRLTFAPGTVGPVEALRIFPLLPPFLEHLSLEGNPVGKEGMLALMKTLEGPQPFLYRLTKWLWHLVPTVGSARNETPNSPRLILSLRSLILDNCEGMHVIVPWLSSHTEVTWPGCVRIDTLSLGGQLPPKPLRLKLSALLSRGSLPYLRDLRFPWGLAHKATRKELFACLRAGACRLLVALDLQGAWLGEDEQIEFVELLTASSLPFLKLLNLMGVSFTSQGHDALLRSLTSPDRPPLEAVDVTANNPSPSHVSLLLSGALPFIRTLSLRNTILPVTLQYLTALRDADQPPLFKFLDIDFFSSPPLPAPDPNVIRLAVESALVDAIRKERMGVLREVGLSHITPSGCSSLMLSFREVGGGALLGGLAETDLPLLELLSLEETKVGSAVSMIWTARRSGRLPSIRELFLSATGAGDAVLEALAETLQEEDFETLRCLHLAQNEFSFRALVSFLDALSPTSFPNLHTLRMQPEGPRGRFGEEGSGELLKRIGTVSPEALGAGKLFPRERSSLLPSLEHSDLFVRGAYRATY